MARSMLFLLLLCGAAPASQGLATTRSGEKVTPMEKVVTLLKGLEAKVVAEGKKEAAEYDKYACFCKEQADEKLYAIEKSEAKIEKLKALIDELDTAISELNGEIGKLSKQISGLETDIKTETDKRSKEYDAYKVKAKDHTEAIDACAAAIEALKSSKGSLEDAKTSFVQLARHPLVPSKASKMLLELSSGKQPKFQYQSNDIIATLEGLLAQFKEMKKDLDNDEFEAKAASDKKVLAMENEKKFATKDKEEKEAVVEAKSEELFDAKEDKDSETKDMDADQDFLDVLTKECETKAGLFDQRSSTRADEIKALNDAIKELTSEGGASESYSVNKKLVGLSQKASSIAPSFVQLATAHRHQSGKEAALQKVRAILTESARKSGSSALVALALKVELNEDHFVKVRGLIKDLITKLKADAKAEMTHKLFCDTEMSKNIDKRDKANANLELATAKIATLTAKIQTLTDEVNDLLAQVADLQKALLEAEQLRAKDKLNNQEATDTSQDGIDSVKAALDILSKFYDNAFLQKTKYVPPNSDRSGKTVADLAPSYGDTTEDYHGSQSESKGIIGILEVILTDFERTKDKTAEDEKDSKEAFETFEKDTNDDIDKKNGKIKTKNGQIDGANAKLLEEEGNEKDAKESLADAEDELKSLKTSCVEGEETWQERAAARKAEIEACKEALAILEDWKGF